MSDGMKCFIMACLYAVFVFTMASMFPFGVPIDAGRYEPMGRTPDGLSMVVFDTHNGQAGVRGLPPAVTGVIPVYP